MRHVDIVPLIGGMTLGSEKAYGTRPDYLLSFEPFWANDRHLVNHYGDDVPYVVLDKNEKPPHSKKIDVVSSTCPCAGLSMMSHGYGDHNPNNQWMPRVANHVLGTIKPKVYWGENAPGFAGKIGKTVRENLRKIGAENGYSMSVYRTKSLLHGVCQVRERAFYFFWQGKKVPTFSWFRQNNEKIEDVISGSTGNSQRDPINSKTPSDDPYYRYLLEKAGVTHRQFCAQIQPLKARGNDVLSYFEKYCNDGYPMMAEWLDKQGFPKQATRCRTMDAKLKAGGSVMRRGTVIPKDYIGAFVGHYPHMLTHPVEDRYINYREAMSIMGLPQNFELLDPKKSSNHVCQNVPVKTASDMAGEVLAALSGKRDWVDTSYMVQYNHSQKTEIGVS